MISSRSGDFLQRAFGLVTAATLSLLIGCDATERAGETLSPSPLVTASATSAGVESAAPIASSAPSASASAPEEDAAPPASASASAAASVSAPLASASAPPSAKADAGPPIVDAGEPDAETPVDAGASDAAAAAAPAPGSADAVAADVDEIFAGKPMFSARFKQEHIQKVSGVVKTSSGTLFVQKPNRVSFRYDPPNNNRIVSDGKTFKLYVAEDKQMFTQPVENTEYPGALSFIMGKGLLPSFSFTFNEKAKFGGGPVLLGKPRAPTPHYETVLFYIDDTLRAKRDPGVIRRVLIVDAQGNRNRFDFEGSTQPTSIDPSEFTFSPPPGTAIKQGG